MCKIAQDRGGPNTTRGPASRRPGQDVGPDPVIFTVGAPLGDCCHCVVCGPTTPAVARLSYVDRGRRRRVRRVALCRAHIGLEVAALQSGDVSAIRLVVARVVDVTVDDVAAGAVA